MCGQDFLIEDGELIRYAGQDTEVIVPQMVAKIGKGAFYGRADVRSVTLPENLTVIGDKAFCGCSRLTSLTIPHRVTRIGYRAFQGCAGLTAFCVSERNPAFSTDENGVLYDKRKLTLVSFPQGCGITSPVIAQSVRTIGVFAFGGCTRLKAVSFPDGVKIIDNDAFSDCSGLISVTLPAGLSEIGYNAFFRCTGLTSVMLPDNMTAVGKGVFAACGNLKEFLVSERNPCCSVDAFGVLFDKRKETLISYPAGNAGVDYTIPDGVREIMRFAFLCSANLTSVTLPVSLRQVWLSAFGLCGNLKLVRYPGTESQFNEILFGRGNEDLLRAERSFSRSAL